MLYDSLRHRVQNHPPLFIHTCDVIVKNKNLHNIKFNHHYKTNSKNNSSCGGLKTSDNKIWRKV